jgi:hypothetical protein
MAALCWAVQGWMQGRWALAGVAISLHLCLMGHWMNSYWGGAVAATGGALVVGAFGRMLRTGGANRNAWPMGAGIVILMLSRPYEGLLLTLPVLAYLVWNRARRPALVPVLGCAACGLAWLGYYDYRVTGNALQMPYTEYYDQYESVSPFNIVPLGTPKVFPHPNFEWVDQGWSRGAWNAARTPAFLLARLKDWRKLLDAVFGNFLWALLPLGFLPWLLRSRKGRWLAGLGLLIVLGTSIEVNLFPHYPAPFQAVLLLLVLSGLRRARHLAPWILLLLVGHRTAYDAWNIVNETTLDRYKSTNGKKGLLEEQLVEEHPVDGKPGRHVVFVKYSVPRVPHEEWIYNPADIDSAPVIWAHDMGDEENARLIAYYRGRSFWRFDPDVSATAFEPYH